MDNTDILKSESMVEKVINLYLDGQLRNGITLDSIINIEKEIVNLITIRTILFMPRNTCIDQKIATMGLDLLIDFFKREIKEINYQ